MAVKVVCALIVLLVPALVISARRGSSCRTPNQELATCEAVRACDVIRDAVFSGNKDAIEFAKQSQCGFDSEPLVCCGSKATLTRDSSECITPNGEKGTCKSLSSCKPILNAIASRKKDAAEFAKQSQCGYANEPLVCCGSNGNFPAPISPLIPSRSECGLPSGGYRVYGGQLTDLREFPWMALLRYRNTDDGSDAGFQCGGTLINQRYVLTAAHCVIIAKNQGIELASVRLGEWKISTERDCEEGFVNPECADPVIDLNIEKQVVNSQYVGRNGKNDIALLRLERNVKYTNFTRPICLPQPRAAIPPPGKQLFVAGWGATENSSSSDTKLKVKLPVVSRSDCNAKIKQRGQITEEQLCAGGVSGKDSCKGDSGGPLMDTYPSDTVEQWYQVGVVSWGVGCGIVGFPAVYTSVSMYVQWIADSMTSF